jgi:iron complex transport system substrate-binding protein
VRIVSLFPAATEIVAALGFADSLVGVSHECDYPPEVNNKPRVTHCEIYGKGLPSAAVDLWVNQELSLNNPLYTVDTELLRELEPDVIVTQQLCDVCAIDYASVVTIANSFPKKPQIVNLSPSSLSDIFSDIRRVAEALGAVERSEMVIESLARRVDAVNVSASEAKSRPRCFLMEWIDPPFCAGHWSPELVELAGGVDPLGKKWMPSIRVSWEQISDAQPEIVVLACCGYDVERTKLDIPILRGNTLWESLPAVRDNKVYVVNGSAYFSRPGPRIVDSLEILAAIIHPEIFTSSVPRTDGRTEATVAAMGQGP